MSNELDGLDFDIPCSIPEHEWDKELHDNRGAKVLITSICIECGTERSTYVCRRFWNLARTVTAMWGTWLCQDCQTCEVDLRHWDL